MAVPVEPRDRAGSGDWPADVADRIEALVGTVRDRTTVPLETLARAIVYGTLAGVMAVAAVVLVAIALVRALTELTGDAWIAHLLVGGSFMVLGAFLLFVKTRPRQAT